MSKAVPRNKRMVMSDGLALLDFFSVGELTLLTRAAFLARAVLFADVANSIVIPVVTYRLCVR